MTVDVAAEVRRMCKMGVPELRARYAEEFGEQTRSGNKDFLIKRIAWQMQASAEGGLTEWAMKRAMEIASDADLRVRWPAGTGPSTLAGVPAPGAGTVVRAAFSPAARGRSSTTLPMAGTIITRRYKDRMIAVKVLELGFEYGGTHFKSLSAVAKAVTVLHVRAREGGEAAPGVAAATPIPADQIERFVTDQIRHIGKDCELVSLVMDELRAQADRQRQDLEAEARGIARERAWLEQLRSAEAGGESTEIDVPERLRACDARAERVQEELSLLSRMSMSRDRIEAGMPSFDAIWETLGPAEKASALRLVLAKVTYDAGSGTISLTLRDARGSRPTHEQAA